MHELSIVTHFFFDDTDLATRPEETLGYILLDELEVTAVRHVTQAMDQGYDGRQSHARGALSQATRRPT